MNKGLTPKDTAFVAKVSEKLVYEYMNLINKNQNIIENQENACMEIFDDDIPF